MTAQTAETLNLSVEDTEVLAAFQRQLAGKNPTVSTQDGQVAPDQLAVIIRRVLNAVSAGRTISISQMPAQITTTTAASLLGVSRPTVMKYIKQGKLSSTMVGSHHRLDTSEVIELLEARKDELRQSVFDVMDLET